ncbi:MAG: A24 family peptidase [Candidatus Nanoarchaeia archaeon]
MGVYVVNINPILLAIALFGTVVGTYTDLKTKLVPDWSNYFLLVAGLGGNAILSLTHNSFLPILFSAIGAGTFFGLGYLLYVSGIWGGGDAKLLAAFGAIFGPTPAVAAWPFLASLWLNILLFGAIFGVIGVIWLLAKNWCKVVPAIKKEFKKNELMMYPLIGIVAVAIILYSWKTVFGVIAILAALTFVLFVFKATEEVCMVKTIKPSMLVEGDWIAEAIKIDGFSYEPKRRGVSKEEITKLIGLEEAGKLKEIRIKDGLPYVPAFLAALLVTIFYGDIFYNLIVHLLGL